MATALRPFMTTGIALVGASVIAVTPVTVPPPQPPAIAVAAPGAAVRTVTADVERTALIDEFFSAVQQSVTETIKLWTETLPNDFVALVSAGRFAHLAVLAVNAAYFTPLTIVAPFVVGVRDSLPMPFGTQNGVINELLELVIQTPVVTGVSILSLFASVIDDGLSPFDAVVGSFGYLTQAVTKTIESIQQIVSTLAGALPIADLQPPQGLMQARQETLAVDVSAVAVDEPDVVPASVNSADLESPTDTVTVAVDTPAAETTETTETTETADTEVPEDEPVDITPDITPDVTPEDVTPNGGTDLSDGNQAEPGVSAEESGDDTDGDGAATVTADDTTVEGTDTETDSGEPDSGQGSDAGSETGQ